MKTSLNLPSDGECAFCAYLRGDRPYTIVYRDASVATFVTREQRGSPHLLVLPLQHRPTILDVTDEEAAALMIAIRKAAAAIERAYAPAGIAVWQNNGTPAGQAICHIHFHVAGTLKQGGTEWGEVDELPLTVTDEIASRLSPFFT